MSDVTDIVDCSWWQ